MGDKAEFKFGDKIEWGSLEDESLTEGYFIAELPSEYKYLVCEGDRTLEYIQDGDITHIPVSDLFQMNEIRHYKKLFTLEEAREALAEEHDLPLSHVEIMINLKIE